MKRTAQRQELLHQWLGSKLKQSQNVFLNVKRKDVSIFTFGRESQHFLKPPVVILYFTSLSAPQLTMQHVLIRQWVPASLLVLLCVLIVRNMTAKECG